MRRALTTRKIIEFSRFARSDDGARQRARATLGGLAEWLLVPATDEETVRGLPDRPGSCVPLLVWNEQLNPDMLLRAAFPLPLRWLEDREGERFVPRELAELARQVCDQLEITGWHIALDDDAGLADLDLSGVSLESQSAWVPLAASLIVVHEGGRPRPIVAATGAWDSQHGVTKIHEACRKAEAARSFGCEWLFLPAANAEETATSGLFTGGLELIPLPYGNNLPRRALQALTLKLEVPPKVEQDGLEACQRYANRMPTSKERDDYLYLQVADHMGLELAKKNKLPHVRKLVLLMSRLPSGWQSIRAFDPEITLLLHSTREEASALQIKQRAKPAVVTLHKIDDIKDCAAIRELVAGLDLGPRDVADVTGGTSGMTAAVAIEAAAAGAAVMHWLTPESADRTGHRTGLETPVWVQSPP